jgi:predicted negative regulator of RcsB-dependent stress response
MEENKDMTILENENNETTKEISNEVKVTDSTASGKSKEDIMIELMKKQLRTSHILLGIMGAILAFFIIVALVVTPKLITTVQSVNEAVATINNEILPTVAELDMNELNDAVATFDKAVGEFDVGEFNAALTSLQKAVAQLDVSALNSAIDNLNTTVEPLADFIKVFTGNNK